MPERFVFSDFRELFAKSNEEKSGDHLAGLAADQEASRRPIQEELPSLVGDGDPKEAAEISNHRAKKMLSLNLEDLSSLREGFSRDAYTIIPHAIDPEQCEAWKTKARELGQEHARAVCRDSQSATLRYRVIPGDVIRDNWPELFEFYSCSTTRNCIQKLTGAETIYVSPHLQSGININLLGETSEIYRWHFDQVPYTLLLYLTTSLPEDGGALELFPNVPSHDGLPDLRHRQKISILPQAGTMVLMDGTRCYHSVAPILRPHIRLSIPMVFPPTKMHERSTGLDAYLYGSSPV